MHKGIVLYASRAGHTARYAKAIADELGYDLRDARKARVGLFDRYHTVIYGGGLYRGRIDGVGFIIDNYGYLYDQDLIIFSVGVAPVDDKLVNQVKHMNIPDHVLRNSHYRPLPGWFDPADAQRSFLHKGPQYDALRSLIERAEAGGRVSPGERIVLEAHRKGTGVGAYDEKSIAAILTAARIGEKNRAAREAWPDV